MNKKIIYLVIGIFPTFFGFLYMGDGIEFLFNHHESLEWGIVILGTLVPVGMGSPFVAVGVFLLWKSYKLFKK